MQNQIIFDTQMKTALTDYIITYLSPKSLTPVEHAALNCHVREDLAKYRPTALSKSYIISSFLVSLELFHDQ